MGSHTFTYQNDVGGGLEPAPQLSGAATNFLCSAALREDLGFGEDGAFAPEAWVPSARRPYLVFSIRVDSRHSRGFPKTAEDCRGYKAPALCPRASVRNPCFSTRLRPLPFRGFVPSFEPMRVWEPRSGRACFRRDVGRRGGGRGGTSGGRMGGGSGSCRGESF